MNSGRFYREAMRLTKLHGMQPSLVQTLANWQWHVCFAPLSCSQNKAVRGRRLPLSAQLCSGAHHHIPSSNTWGWLAMVTWNEVEIGSWRGAHFSWTVRAMLPVSKRHLSPQSARAGQFCRVGHGHSSDVTWTWRSPQNCFCPMDFTCYPSHRAHRALQLCSLCPVCFPWACSL